MRNLRRNRISVGKVNMAINQFFLSVLFKMFSAIMLAIVMVISLIHLAQDLHRFLGLFEYGELFQLITFISIFLICGLSLFLMFRRSKKNQVPVHLNTAMESIFPFDLQTLKINFIEGFLQGLTKDNKIHSQDDNVNSH